MDEDTEVCAEEGMAPAVVLRFGTSRKMVAKNSSLTVRQLDLIRDSALLIEWIVLSQVESNVLVKGGNDILLNIQLLDERIEDFALDVLGRRVPGAVAGVGAGAGADFAGDIGAGAGVEAWYREGEEAGDGGEGGEEG